MANSGPIALNEHGDASYDQRLRAVCLLTKLDPESDNWDSIAGDLSAILVNMNPLESTRWLPALKPVREKLLPSLRTYFDVTDEAGREGSEQSAALIAWLFEDRPKTLTKLVETATPTQLAWLLPPLQEKLEVAIEQSSEQLLKRETVEETERNIIAKANLVIALIQMGSSDYWSYLDRSQHVSVATEIIERLGPSTGFNSIAIEQLTTQLANWQHVAPAPMASLILSMGQFSRAQIPQARRESLISVLLVVFAEHPDVEVHSASRWLLNHWKATSELASAELTLRSPDPPPGYHWHVDQAGNTFAIFEPVDQLWVGISEAHKKLALMEGSVTDGETLHLRRIPRRFGICIHEVTNAQFETFKDDMVTQWKQQLATLGPEDKTVAGQIRAWIKDVSRRKKGRRRQTGYSPDAPVVDISWFRALAYCRWLSDKYSTGNCLGRVTMQQLYRGEKDLPLLQKHLRKSGYRLPTAAEWEYACRASTNTLRPYGSTLSQLDAYSWYGANRNFSSHPVGMLKPNGFGLFDILGNVSEWCLTWHDERLPDSSLAISSDLVVAEGSDLIWPDIGEFQKGWQSLTREYRGGSHRNNAGDLRTSKRFHLQPILGETDLGFRLARTYEVEEEIGLFE